MSAELDPRRLAFLALVAVGVLVLGYGIRPREGAPEPPVVAPSQTDTSRLHRLALRSSVDGLSEYFAFVAGDVEPGLVRLAESAGTGIAWGPDYVVAARLTRRASRSVLLGSAQEVVRGVTVVSGPHLPLLGVQVPAAETLSPPPHGPAVALQMNQWLLAVWSGSSSPAFAPGLYLGTSPGRCGDIVIQEVATSMTLTPAMAGGGLFDLDGNLAAVVLPCGERLVGVAVESVDMLLRLGDSFEGRLLARYGLSLDPYGPDAERVGAESGVVVREVWRDHPADAAGLRPGDVIQLLDEAPIDRPMDLTPLLFPITPESFEIGYLRGGQPGTARLSALAESLADATAAGAGVGVVWNQPAAGYAIDVVYPGGRAAAAGLEEGDRVLRVDQREPESWDELQELLAASEEPVFVELERRGRRFGVILD